MTTAIRANLWLVLVTLFWGVTFPVIELADRQMAPVVFVVIRFILAAVVLLPFILRDIRHTQKKWLLGALYMGIFNSLIYVTQTIGLQTTTAARSAFITGSNVILVPLLLPLFSLGKPTKLDYIFAVICLLGLYILTGADFSDINSGDAWSFACAVFYALGILTLQKITDEKTNSRLFAFYQIGFTIPFSAMWLPFSDVHWQLSANVIFALVYCGVIATSLVLFLQTHYQRYTSATNAAIIYTLEPIFAAIFARFITHEQFTWNVCLGGGLIVLSVLAIELVRALQLKF